MSRSSWNILVVPKSKLTGFLIRGTQNIDTEERGDGYMKMEAKKCPRSPEAGRGREQFSPPKPLERVWPCCCLETVKKYISAVASLPVEGAGHSELGNRRLTRHMTAASKINSPRSAHVAPSPYTAPSQPCHLAISFLSIKTRLKFWILRGHVFLS